MQREEKTCSSAAALCHTKVKRGQKMKKIKMQPVTKTTLTTILSTLALVVAIGFARETEAKSQASEATMSIFATGLNNPRGLKFGPDAFIHHD
jgi:hypothetical protein